MILGVAGLVAPGGASAFDCDDVLALLRSGVPASQVVSALKDRGEVPVGMVSCLEQHPNATAVLAALNPAPKPVPSAPTALQPKDFLLQPGRTVVVESTTRFGKGSSTQTATQDSSSRVRIVRTTMKTVNLVGDTVEARDVEGYEADRDGNIWLVLQSTANGDAQLLDPPGFVLAPRDVIDVRDITFPNGLTLSACIGVVGGSGALRDFYCKGLGWVGSQAVDGSSWQSQPLSVK